MIELIIPTYGRINKQLTLYRIPESMREFVTVVVQDQEVADFKAAHPWVKVWGLPPGTKGIAKTRMLIAHHWKGKRYIVMEDDLSIKALSWGTEKILSHNATEEEWYRAIKEIEGYMDEGIVHGSIHTHGIVPSDDPFVPKKNTRIERVNWASENYPVDKIKFMAPEQYAIFPEDFYVNLQLLTMGYENRVLEWFRWDTGGVQDKGGCSDYRTLENHNAGSLWLAEQFPEFVKTRIKQTATGPWKGLDKVAFTVYWNKAYKSSQNKQKELL